VTYSGQQAFSKLQNQISFVYKISPCQFYTLLSAACGSNRNVTD